jgi:putative SOS response-associated peptidase YedK
MCGRYTHLYKWKQIHDLLSLKWPSGGQLELDFSYNVAPTQSAPIVRLNQEGERGMTLAKWGLIPSWAKDPKIGNSLINARADTAATKPAFRAAFKKRRCLVPVSGFYEWQKLEGSKAKQPWYIKPAGGGVMCFAGLWEWWKAEGEQGLGEGSGGVESFTIVTTDANEQMKAIHHRMPVILEPESFDAWLDPGTKPEALQALLVPAADGVLDMHRVSALVNKPQNNAVQCVEPMG